MIFKISNNKQIYDIAIENPREGENYVICPICTSSRKYEHQGEKKLSINTSKFPKPWRCKHCDARGYVLEKDYVASLPVKPITALFPSLSINDKLAQWFYDQRHIGIATLRHFNIRMSEETVLMNKTSPNDTHLKGKWINQKCINFNYYMDQMLINIKFRDFFKNFKFLKGASLIMYNLDSLEGYDYAVITEGEFEPLSYYEAGIIPVISVPNGSAISPSEVEEYKKTGNINLNTGVDMTYLDNSLHKMKHIKTFYLATDDDAAGFKLRELLAKRLGKSKCKYIEFGKWKRADGTPCNDPNDVLVNNGKEQLSYTLQKAKTYPVKDVITAKVVKDKISFSYDNETPPGLTTGFKTLDPHWRWMPGYFYALNGWPQMGKTTFMMNMAVVSASMYGWKWGVYSPENYPIDRLVEMIIEIYLGNTIQFGWSSQKNPRAQKKEVIAAIEEFVERHFHFVEDRMQGYTPEEMREIKLRLWETNGVNCFFTDPWKNLRHDDNLALERYLNRELSSEVRFTASNNVINVISAHPPTPDRGKPSPDAPSPFMMYGGAVWLNSVYGMICVHRTNKKSMTDMKVEIHVQKMKDQKLAGVLTDEPIILDFSRRSNRYLENGSGDNEYDTFPLDVANIKDINLFNQF